MLVADDEELVRDALVQASGGGGGHRRARGRRRGSGGEGAGRGFRADPDGHSHARARRVGRDEPPARRRVLAADRRPHGERGGRRACGVPRGRLQRPPDQTDRRLGPGFQDRRGLPAYDASRAAPAPSAAKTRSTASGAGARRGRRCFASVPHRSGDRRPDARRRTAPGRRRRERGVAHHLGEAADALGDAAPHRDAEDLLAQLGHARQLRGAARDHRARREHVLAAEARRSRPSRTRRSPRCAAG